MFWKRKPKSDNVVLKGIEFTLASAAYTNSWGQISQVRNVSSRITMRQ